MARRLGVAGQIKNLEDGDVEIIAQGEEKKIDEFAESLTSIPLPANVESVKIKKPMKVSKQRRTFKIVHGNVPEELDEGLGAGQEQLALLSEHFASFSTNTSKNFNTLADRYDKISDALAILTNQSKQFTDTLTTLTNLAKEYFEERRSERGNLGK